MSGSYSGNAQSSVANSSMAIVSLVSGILGLTLLPMLGSIVALIVGYIAKQEIRDSRGMLGGDGMATAGLVLGWIGVGLTVIGCCIGAFFILIPACLLPLGLSLDQFGASILSFVVLL